MRSVSTQIDDDCENGSLHVRLPIAKKAARANKNNSAPSAESEISALTVSGEDLVEFATAGGKPGTLTRPLPLFMDAVEEEFAVCLVDTTGCGKVLTSPGYGLLVNGDVNRGVIERNAYLRYSLVTLRGTDYRIVQTTADKVLLMVDVKGATDEGVLTLLNSLDDGQRCRTISIDVLEVGDYRVSLRVYARLKTLANSKRVILYTRGGSDLEFMLRTAEVTTPSVDSWDLKSGSQPSPPTASAAQQLQEAHLVETREKALEERREEGVKSGEKRRDATVLSTALGKAVAMNSVSRVQLARKMAVLKDGDSNPLVNALQAFTGKDIPGLSDEFIRSKTFPKLTKADMRQVSPPKYLIATNVVEHLVNAFIEFMALTEGNLRVTVMTCSDILNAYVNGDATVLREKLLAEGATIYDNSTGTVLLGDRNVGPHMVAYSRTTGMVPLVADADDSPSGAAIYDAPEADPIVVLTKSTKILLDDRVLRRAQALMDSDVMPPSDWPVPEFEWVNGVPGCGKTSWIVSHFSPMTDMVVTTTVEACKDVVSRLEKRLGKVNKRQVRTLASVLVNEVRENEGCDRLLFDEALMNHFGAVVMACRVTGARNVVLIGDVNQIPYIDRQNLFKLLYAKPNCVTEITRELLCTHRNPQDVAYALRSVYNGIYSSKSVVGSMTMRHYSGTIISPTAQDTLYLVHTQSDKETLNAQGFGKGAGARLLTIHEAQGLTYKHVVIIRATTKKLHIFDSVPHAVVAVSRHTATCVYYSDDFGDAIARFIREGEGATEAQVRDYNIKMAVRKGDDKVLRILTDKTSKSDAVEESRTETVVWVPTVKTVKSTPHVESSAPVVQQSSAMIPVIDAVSEVISAHKTSSLDNSDSSAITSFMSASEGVSDKTVHKDLVEFLMYSVKTCLQAHLEGCGGVSTLEDVLAVLPVKPEQLGVDTGEEMLELMDCVRVEKSGDAVVVRLRLSGGYTTGHDSINIRVARRSSDAAHALLEGLTYATHSLKCYMSTTYGFSAPVGCTVSAGKDHDVKYLQTVYDDFFPEHALTSYEHDQLCVDNSDLTLYVDRLMLEPGKSFLQPKTYATLVPTLRTMMPSRRLNSQRESVLGLLKRNLNAPVLTEPSMTRHYVGECMAKNFLKSAVDPEKVWLLEEYASDVIELHPALVDKWLQQQKPSVATSAVSDTPLEHRTYNQFSYMVKADLKPPLDPSAAHEYASVQTIAYNRKDVNVIFCPVLLEVRDRLINVLKTKLKIFTGMSPEAFINTLNNEFNVEELARCNTVENDMRKYDKSQDAGVLQFECSIMRAMGVSPELVEIWYSSHAESSLFDRFNGTSAKVNFQRRSGDASTFLGNTLFVMAVTLATYDVDDIVCGLFAGDDSLLYMRSHVQAEVDNSSRLAALFNLECKLLTGYKFPYFCSKFVVIHGERMHLIPDPLKFLTKLGRSDLRDFDHVEEYRMSAMDNLACLGNEVWYHCLSLALCERYKQPERDLTKFFRVLNTIVSSETLFATLYRMPETGKLCSDPSRLSFNIKREKYLRSVALEQKEKKIMEQLSFGSDTL